MFFLSRVYSIFSRGIQGPPRARLAACASGQMMLVMPQSACQLVVALLLLARPQAAVSRAGGPGAGGERGHPRPDTSGCFNGTACPANFSAQFQSSMVLQSKPSQAAVYGMAPVAGAVVTVHLAGVAYTATVDTIFTWKVLFPPQPPGGDVTVSAACTKGCTNTTATVLHSVTFGDVWVCSGQSNAELSVGYTFYRNESVASILAGRYDNLRMMLGTHKSSTAPQWVHQTAGGTRWARVTDLVNASADPQSSALFGFPAMCFYFGKSLTDKMRNSSSAPPPPLGMVNAVWGGTMIEQWVPNSAQPKCATWHSPGGALQPDVGGWGARITPSCVGCTVNASSGGCNVSTHPKNCAGNGALFNGNIAPLANMTVKGITWYQGENNAGGDAGSVIQNTGYACMLLQLAKAWQAAFSSTPNTTPSDVPFGVVLLHWGSWEGSPANGGQMHWAETLNHGVLPNPMLPSGFVATAHDIGDPWNTQLCCRGASAAKKGTPASPGLACCCANQPVDHEKCVVSAANEGWGRPGATNRTLYPFPIAPYTNVMISAIHPRTKQYVGRRLATAAWATAYGHSDEPAHGPVISGCSLSSGGVGSAKEITLYFNTSLMKTDTLHFKGCYKQASTGGLPSCATQVLLGTSGSFPRAQAIANHHGAPKEWDYNCSLLNSDRCGNFSTTKGLWQYVGLKQGTLPGTVIVDLSMLDDELWRDDTTGEALSIIGVRYARWSAIDRPICCGAVDFSTEPCPPNSCPLSGSGSDLPAMPFEAEVVDGYCHCLTPQSCDQRSAVAY